MEVVYLTHVRTVLYTFLLIGIFSMQPVAQANPNDVHCPWDQEASTSKNINIKQENSSQGDQIRPENVQSCNSNIKREKIQDPSGNFEAYKFYPSGDDRYLTFGVQYQKRENGEYTTIPEHIYHPGNVTVQTKNTYNDICRSFLGDQFRLYTLNGKHPTSALFSYTPKRKPLSYNESGQAVYNDGVRGGFELEVEKQFRLYNWNQYKALHVEGKKDQPYSSYLKNHPLLQSFACGKRVNEINRTETTFIDPVDPNVQTKPSIDSHVKENQTTTTTQIETPSISIDTDVPSVLPFTPEFNENPLFIVDMSGSIASSQCLGVNCLVYIIYSLEMLVKELDPEQYFNIVLFDEWSQFILYPNMQKASSVTKTHTTSYLRGLIERRAYQEEKLKEYTQLAKSQGLKMSGYDYLIMKQEENNELTDEINKYRSEYKEAKANDEPVSKRNQLIGKVNDLKKKQNDFNKMYNRIMGSVFTAEDLKDPRYHKFDPALDKHGKIKQERLPIILEKADTDAQYSKHYFIFSDFEYLRYDNDRSIESIKKHGLINEAYKSAKFLNDHNYPVTIKTYGDDFEPINIEQFLNHTYDATNNEHTPEQGNFQSFIDQL